MTNSAPIRIPTVDDHPVVLPHLVGIQPDITVITEAANGRDGIQRL
jgi:hypothetical protein